MSDIFSGNDFASVSDKDWRSFISEAQRPLIDAPKDTRVSRTADFAKQLEKAQLAEQNASIDVFNSRIDIARKQERDAKAAEKAAVKDSKDFAKLGLPDVSEQKPLPANWFEAQKATGYDQLPFTEQSKIYSDWLDQAHVRIVTADRSKAKTAREELEKRIPAPVKPKADFFDTDIIDKARIGGNALLEGVYKVGSALMPEGEGKQNLYNKALEADQEQKDLRASLSPETLDAEKATAFRKNQLIAKYGSEDAIPAWEGFKQGVSSMTQGGVLQTVGNVTQSLASSAPSVVGNVMRVGGAALTATGPGAVIGVPLMAAGTGLATLGGAVATAGDVGGEAYDEAFKFAKSQGLDDAAARAKADEAARTGGAAGAGLGALEGFLGAKFGAGAAAKAGLKAGAKRAGIETVTEAAAEGAGQASVNAVLQGQGDQRSLMRGVAESSAQGAIGGLGMSAGTQALASVTGTEAPSGPVQLQNTPAAVQAGVSAASAATNTVATAAQAAVVEAQAAAQAAQATGDDTQVAATTAALQAATAQAQAVGAEPVAASPMAALQAAAAAQDGLDAAIATGDPVQIEQATQAFNTAVAATQTVAAPAVNTPASATIDPAISERESINGIQIRDMLDKVEAIPQLIENTKLGLAGAKQALDAAQPLANAVGRGVNMGSEGQQWVKSIETGAAPIDAIAADSTIEPAQREAAQAVIQAYKATGTALPEYNKSLPVRGNTAGYIQHDGLNPTVPAKIALNKKIATPATIIHEYLHGLTVRGLEFMNMSRNPEHMDVLEGLDAIMTFISQHPSVTNTRAGGVYATTNNKELLAEALSGRVLPLTSNITVQDIINKGGLTNGAIRGLEILTNRQPTTLLQLFTKARDYILNAMGLAAAKKGSVSDAILSAADIAMEEQRAQVQRVDKVKTDGVAYAIKHLGTGVYPENLLPGYTHLGKNAQGNFATSIDQLIVDATPVQDGIYRTADGTVLDTNDSIAQVASNPSVQALLKDNGFEGFRTEAGETFALGSVDAEQLPALDKQLATTIANISYSITDPATTDSQRLKYVAKFLNGTLEPALMEAVNRTGVGLTARAAIETQAPWAEAVMSGDDTLLQVLATSKSDIGEGVAEQARAVLRMYAESGRDLPKIVKIRGLIPFDGDTALGTYDPPTHRIEISDLADPGHIVHEYLHGVTQLGIDAAAESKDGKALRAVMQHMITAMRTTAVRAGEKKPYALTNEHEMMGDMFNPAFLRIAAQTPIGTPASKQAQAMISELMGEQPGTMIQLLDALIRKIVSFLGVKSVPNNMTELLSRVAARATDETRKAVNSIDMEVVNTAPFKTWFGDSKVVNDDGSPRVMYTGTSSDKDFTSFKMPRNGTWFTRWPDVASDYAVENDSKGLKYNPDTRKYDDVNSASRVMPVYVKIENPYPMTAADQQAVNVNNYKAAQAKLFDRLRAEGYDGVQWGPSEWVAIGKASQIKSAIGNNGNFDPALSRIDMEVLPPSAVPLSAATFKNQLTGRTSSAAFIASISAGVNVQPVLQINKLKALAQGDETQTANIKNKLNDAIHDSQGPAKRWLQALPISENARERIINVLYLAPGKRDTILNNAMEKHGGDAMVKALAAIKKGAKGLTHETVTQWVGQWITANHVAEKNAMLVARRAQAHNDAAQAAALKPNDFRLKLKEAEALQAYTDQVKAVSSTNLDAGSENGPPHAMGVAGGMNNAQAAATMQAVEDRFDIDQLRAVAEAVYDMNAFRLALDIEQGKTQVATVAKFLNITPAEQQRLQDLQDARNTGTVTEAMRDAARVIVRSEYVPMTGHPLSAIDDPTDGLFSAGAAQPNTGKDYVMEGRTRGIADNGIATSMKGLIRSATFAGYADFTSGIGEVYDMLTPDQRTAVGLAKDSINGLTRGSDNVLLDGRTNNTVGYSIQDAKVLEAIRAGNVDEQDGLLRKFAMPTTRMFAYLVTQANPLFGPKNLINDMIERSLIASTREYHTEAGSKVTIGATDVVANTAASLAAVNRLIRGKADYNNDADAALRDFIADGGLSTSREAFARDAKALAQRVRGVGTGADPRVAVRAVGGWIEKYNKQFDMVAPLASYLALRSAGVSKVDAAGGALDLMNYRKKGAKTSGFVTPLYAFAQPAFTGGANLLTMLGTPKGKKIAVTALVAFLALQALSEAGADEDEGGNLIRQLPNYARNNNINVQMGSNVVSIPVGFGVTKLANTAARAILDFGNKGNSIPKSIYDVLSEGFMTSLTPFEDNDIKDPLKNIAYGLSPTIAKGAAGYILNARADGGQIDREKWIDQGKYRHMQGSKTIAPAYRDMAEMLYSATGWDMTPDAMKYLVQSYGIGPFKHVVASTITNPQKEAEGKDTGLPVIGSFIAPVFKPVNEDAWRGQMRKAQEDMDDMRKETEKLELDKTSEGRQALRELQARPEYRLMGQFDVMDKGLRSESAAVTRSLNKKQITATEEERRRDAIRDRRKDQEAQFLVKWRKIKGLE